MKNPIQTEEPKGDTTTKIPAELNQRLWEGAQRTRLSRSVLLRLCIEIGVPHLERKFDEMREKVLPGVDGLKLDGAVGVSLAMGRQQLEELRELYRSAVTDVMPGLNGLVGEDFVDAAEKALAKSKGYSRDTVERIRRFLMIYAQLF